MVQLGSSQKLRPSLVYTRPNYTRGEDDVPTRTEECLCVRSKTRQGVDRELIVARSRDRPNYEFVTLHARLA
jgi:hypothetical protein